MTVLARRVRATPHRPADQAWNVIVELIAEDGPSREELLRIGGVASSIVASEAAKNDPIVVYGGGSRVRVYCLYDEEAITGDSANEQNLPKSPTDGDWAMSLPCQEEDLQWIAEALAKKSKRVKARKLGAAVEADPSEGEDEDASAMRLDEEAFFRP